MMCENKNLASNRFFVPNSLHKKKKLASVVWVSFAGVWYLFYLHDIYVVGGKVQTGRELEGIIPKLFRPNCLLL
jgi:hypothetical protein